MVRERQRHVFSNSETLEKTAFIAKYDSDAQPLLLEFLGGKFCRVAPEKLVETSKGPVQTGGGRQQVAFPAGWKSAYRPVLTGSDGPCHLFDRNPVRRVRI